MRLLSFNSIKWSPGTLSRMTPRSYLGTSFLVQAISLSHVGTDSDQNTAHVSIAVSLHLPLFHHGQKSRFVLLELQAVHVVNDPVHVSSIKV